MRDGALRPVVHAALLGFAFLAPVLGRWGMAGVAAAALATNALLLPRSAFGRLLARPGEPRWNGLLSYPLAVALLFALLPLEAAVGGWAVLALGDPAAALAGGGPALPWNRRKTARGSAAFVAAGFAGAALVVAGALPAVMGLPRARLLEGGDGTLLYAGWIGAGVLAGALAETLDLGIDDNLPVALAAGGTLALLSP